MRLQLRVERTARRVQARFATLETRARHNQEATQETASSCNAPVRELYVSSRRELAYLDELEIASARAINLTVTAR